MIDLEPVMLDILRASHSPATSGLIETRVAWDEGDLLIVLCRKMTAGGNENITPQVVRNLLERLERKGKARCDENGEWAFIPPIPKKEAKLFEEADVQ